MRVGEGNLEASRAARQRLLPQARGLPLVARPVARALPTSMKRWPLAQAATAFISSGLAETRRIQGSRHKVHGEAGAREHGAGKMLQWGMGELVGTCSRRQRPDLLPGETHST